MNLNSPSELPITSLLPDRPTDAQVDSNVPPMAASTGSVELPGYLNVPKPLADDEEGE